MPPWNKTVIDAIHFELTLYSVMIKSKNIARAKAFFDRNSDKESDICLKAVGRIENETARPVCQSIPGHNNSGISSRAG
jgi:hypothetical protein